ncbi:hypothetical protein M413DRAFT_21124 [Hebeloma cylindrosporum]|uniref:Hydrophobin n=1 Tax=Hebeloma cylindrosporum TaxID=76867 RepID=A0A0C3CJC3_HEBCY|nr:hypothetical protein M413DRAFT_21124 [Hebeloma cylindrosporum h7]
MLAFKSLIVLGLPLIVAANPLVARNDPPAQCNTGKLACCDSTHKVETHDDPVSLLLGLLGIDALLGELLGFGCSPISVVGVGGTTCLQQTLCCTGNSYNGGPGASSLINIGCSPITIIL